MSTHLERAQILFHQERFDLAEQELRQELDERSEATVQYATPADARRAEEAANPDRSGSTP